MKNATDLTTMQEFFLMGLAMQQVINDPHDSKPKLQVTRDFFKELAGLDDWQGFHKRLLSELVLAGYLEENIGSHGTIFYSLTQAAWASYCERMFFARKHVFSWVPQTASMFDLSGERE